MNTFLTPSSWLLLVPLGVALTWGACRWWYARQLQRLEHRIGKLQADRETLQEQVKRARQQLAQVQKDMSSWRQAVAAHGKGGAAPAEAKPPPPVVKLQPDIPLGLVFEPPQLAAHGFADTQPFESEAMA